MLNPRTHRIAKLAGWIFVVLFAWNGGVQAQTVRRDVLHRRVLKQLDSSREATRMRALLTLRQNPACLFEFFDDYVTQVEKLTAKAVETEKFPTATTIALIATLSETQRPEAEAMVRDLLQCDAPELVMVGLDRVGVDQHTDCIDTVMSIRDTAAFRDHYAMRHAVVHALIPLKSQRANESLLALREQLDGQLAADIDRHFETVTATDFVDATEHRRWWTRWQRTADPENEIATAGGEAVDHNAEDSATRPASFRSAEEESELDLELDLSPSDSDDEGPLFTFGPQQYYGIDIESKRTLFLIDHSGSMKDHSSGRTRLDAAKFELIRTLRTLSPEHEFSIMIFSTGTHLWKKTLVEANAENKQAAIRFVRAIRYGDRTSTYDALVGALSFDDDLEAVYVLTDGQPTSGRVRDPAVIVRDVTQRNQFRRVRFHTIGIQLPPKTKQFLRAIAAENGGEFREVF